MSIPNFTTLGTYEITGRGTAHAVDVPEALLAKLDPRTLRGEEVLLDGKLVRVLGVDAHSVQWPHAALRTVGLVVRDVR